MLFISDLLLRHWRLACFCQQGAVAGLQDLQGVCFEIVDAMVHNLDDIEEAAELEVVDAQS